MTDGDCPLIRSTRCWATCLTMVEFYKRTSASESDDTEPPWDSHPESVSTTGDLTWTWTIRIRPCMEPRLVPRSDGCGHRVRVDSREASLIRPSDKLTAGGTKAAGARRRRSGESQDSIVTDPDGQPVGIMSPADPPKGTRLRRTD